MTNQKRSIVPIDHIEDVIFLIRGYKVMLDQDLAVIYGTTTKRINEQVKRNMERFPKDFMFQLSKGEWEILRSQIATSKPGRGGRRTVPFVFTEHGAVMLANVLNSKSAIEASIQVVRTFIRLRRMIAGHRELSERLDKLERRYDKQFKVVFQAIRELMEPPQVEKKPRIGFNR